MSGRVGRRFALICGVAMACTLALLPPVGASPEPYLLYEDSSWLVRDHGANDGLTRLRAKDLDNDGTVEVVVVGFAAVAGSEPDAFVGVYRIENDAWVLEAEFTKDFRGGFDALTGVEVLDYDSDGTDEIIVTGYGTNAVATDSDRDIIVGVLRKTGSQLVAEVDWYTKDFASAQGRKNWGTDIAVGDIDDDQVAELVVVSSDDLGAYVDTPMRIGVLSLQGGTPTEGRLQRRPGSQRTPPAIWTTGLGSSWQTWMATG